MKKISKNAFSLFMLLSIIVPIGFMAMPAHAINPWGDPFDNTVGYDAFNSIQMGRRDPRAIAASVINIMLGLLGVLAVVIILMGGFKWMTASGNDDKISDAKKLLGAGVVGLLIVLSAYAVSIYIMRSFLFATGANGGTAPTGTQYELDSNIAQ